MKSQKSKQRKAAKKAARTKNLKRLKNIGLPSPAWAKKIAEQNKEHEQLKINTISPHSAME